MGGRAGAAAIEDRLYFDVLSSSWRAAIGKSPDTSPAEVVEFFAHEAHHLGYGQILDRKRASFQFSPAEDQAWRFLTAILMEGSATFLSLDMKRWPNSTRCQSSRLIWQRFRNCFRPCRTFCGARWLALCRTKTMTRRLPHFLEWATTQRERRC